MQLYQSLIAIFFIWLIDLFELMIHRLTFNPETHHLPLLRFFFSLAASTYLLAGQFFITFLDDLPSFCSRFIERLRRCQKINFLICCVLISITVVKIIFLFINVEQFETIPQIIIGICYIIYLLSVLWFIKNIVEMDLGSSDEQDAT